MDLLEEALVADNVLTFAHFNELCVLASKGLTPPALPFMPTPLLVLPAQPSCACDAPMDEDGVVGAGTLAREKPSWQKV